jgi:cysteine protease ATG4
MNTNEKDKELNEILNVLQDLIVINDNNDNTLKINHQFNFKMSKISINNSLLETINKYENIVLFHKSYKSSGFHKFYEKFNKLIYFCYRKDTYPMKTKINLPISRDSGWGCMIRCGQMIMSRAIYKYLKSKKYSTENAIVETIKYFLDEPYTLENIPTIFSSITSKFTKCSNNSKILPPFGIHAHCLLGKRYSKYAGEWFSDVNICSNYRHINNCLNIFPDMKIFSFISDFILHDVLDACFIELKNDENISQNDNILDLKGKKYKMQKCMLIFISVRLGINKITNVYHSSLKKCFECKECIGIIGGEKNLAHYFIGYNSKGNMIYLDPHITRDSIKYLNDDIVVNDCLTKNMLEISLDNMSTGLSFGFLCRNLKEFEDFLLFLENFNNLEYPCFSYVKNKIEIDDQLMENIFNDQDDF